MTFCIIHYNKCYSYLPHDVIAHWKVKIRIEHQVPLTCSTDVDHVDVCENSPKDQLLMVWAKTSFSCFVS